MNFTFNVALSKDELGSFAGALSKLNSGLSSLSHHHERVFLALAVPPGRR